MKKVKIGYPLEYEDEVHIIRNGVFLRENEVEALNKKLKQLEAYENMRKEAIEYVKWQRDNPQYDNVWRNSECESLLNILNKVGEDNANDS